MNTIFNNNSYFPNIISRFCFILIFTLICFSPSCDNKPTEVNEPLTDWEISSPKNENLDEDLLSELTFHVGRKKFGNISSLLIVRNSKLVYEEYFQGEKQRDLHKLYSVTKSITSILFGIAVDEGKINNLDTTILSYFPEYEEIENMSADKEDITLRDVLTMRAGFDWDEWSTIYNAPNNPIVQMISSDDWIEYILDLPMSDSPGEEFTYNSGCTVLLSGVLEKATGMSVEEYAQEKLFSPLGIDTYIWSKTTKGLSNTGFGLNMRPRDMLKIGYLIYQDGSWDGKRILSSEWIAESITPYTDFTNGEGYGYQWWLYPVEYQEQEIKIPYASGWGHQHIFIIEHYDMIIVSTAEDYLGQPFKFDEILNEYIFPAVLE